ncbi:site-specific DNA-methyltransferase [Massilia sp. CCM 9206]|uniref:site-specific DNA-methyltransferase n=1 Tax=Massilia pseudoviolaceinigra TaxID=3057165 RepID=UPI002796A538|nr:site-specific DNA-methyltransferase [Massilia sp. CCM 9206]MDQ1921656.1 site-specific DNA-methyltransferase [Massilia sp. CCM 9206]
MKPYTIIHGDCISEMSKLPANSVDSIVCDPPYGLSEHGTPDIIACMTAWMAGVPYLHKKAGFMGNTWDSFVPGPEVWRECIRVLKPGGYMLVFASTRTDDLMSMACRLAGFRKHPFLAWIFGSGFPKAANLGKAFDKEAGAKREVISTGAAVKRMIPGADQNDTGSWIPDNGREYVPTVTAPTTNDAKQWDGWAYGLQALKPAMEPILMFQKPHVGRMTDNVRKFGTGAINIDACRVPTDDNLNGGAYAEDGGRTSLDGDERVGAAQGMFQAGKTAVAAFVQPEGRWPANIIHDGSDEVVAAFPESSVTGKRTPDSKAAIVRGTTWLADNHQSTEYADSGSAARFFYCAKASKSDRNSGLDGFVEVVIEWNDSTTGEIKWGVEARQARLWVATEQSVPRVTAVFGAKNSSATEWNTMLSGKSTTGQSPLGSMSTTATRKSYTTPSKILSFFQNCITNGNTVGANYETASGGSPVENAGSYSASMLTTNEWMASALGASRAVWPMRLKLSASVGQSSHPTVKPTDLMAYLCRLVTPPGGVVLDPFMGSGSTGKACMREGFEFIGIDMTAEYLPIAQARIEHELAKVTAAAELAAIPAPQLDMFAGEVA